MFVLYKKKEIDFSNTNVKRQDYDWETEVNGQLGFINDLRADAIYIDHATLISEPWMANRKLSLPVVIKNEVEPVVATKMLLLLMSSRASVKMMMNKLQ